MPPKYKLSYFNMRGRGEFVRLTLKAAGQEFEDERITFDQWAEKKPKTPQGSMPVLEVPDGAKTDTIVQTMTILRHLARVHDLYGKKEKEMYIVDQLLDNTADVVAAASQLSFIKDEAEKTEKTKAFKEGALPNYFKFTENLMKKTGENEYAVGKSLTVGDVAINVALDLLKDLQPDVPELLKDNQAKFEGLPLIKAYLKERS